MTSEAPRPEAPRPEAPASEAPASEAPASEAPASEAEPPPQGAAQSLPRGEAQPPTPADDGTRAQTLASLAGEPAPGATTVLIRNAIPAGSGPAPADAGVTYVASRRQERLLMALSTVLGTIGLLLAVAAAGLDQVRYNLPAPCAAYQTNHRGAVAFGCTDTAKKVAVLLPVIGIPLLVLIGLIVVWVPGWRPKARLGLLIGLGAVIVVCAVIVALAYTALPKQ